MKSDSSRDTFDPRKHFSSVRMQQGRVQLDADWNEQHDIVVHRVRAEAADVVGSCGGPLHHAAFHIVGNTKELSAEEQALPGNNAPVAGFKFPDFLISAGHYYVDGILCENEQLTSYLNQPDLPGARAIADPGLYIVYLDVWQRHLTALDDPSIREIALGGPDTATRTKAVWQVKYWFAGTKAGNCLTPFPDFDASIAPGDGTLSARAKPEQTSADACIVPPGAGYRGLENQLYRVEVHDGGSALDVTSGSSTPVTRVANTDNKVRFTGSGAAWKVGQAVEIFSGKAGRDPMNGTLAYIAAKDDGAKTLTLNITVPRLDEPRLRPAQATYKWSRNNGAIVTAVESINGPKVTVHDLGPDAVLGFKKDQWIEISDDGLELRGQPGQLAQISAIDRAINLITLNVAPSPLSAQAGGVDKKLHPKLRGWDGVGAIKLQPDSAQDHFLSLEDGVQVRFSAGVFKSGDCWNIPARTATADTQSGNIEWPSDLSGVPLAQLPSGIKHRYCRLAMLRWDGSQFVSIEDCRHLFPPVTELTSLFYVSGDGQEALPDLTKPNLLVQLPQPVVVGVANGSWPVANAKVRLQVTRGNGQVLPGTQGGAQVNPKTLDVRTDLGGLASCSWQTDSVTQSQQLTATLFDADDHPVHLPVIVTANLSVADQVAYDPKQCGSLQNQKTVQQAIDRLSQLVSLYEAGGNNQEVMPGVALEPLRVLAASKCGPLGGQKVRFDVIPGSGTVNPTEANTDANGFATTSWSLNPSTPRQQVRAVMVGGNLAAPASVLFTANLSVASQIAYTPDAKCPELVQASATTVQKALNELCKHVARPDPGIRILNVAATADKKPLMNDTLVPVKRLESGIIIECDAALAPESVGQSPNPPSNFPAAVAEKPTCFVTLDLPYPIGSDRNLWDGLIGTETIGFESVILASTVTIKANTILWTPTAFAGKWLQSALFTRFIANKIADRVLAHLTLKGNFIWSKDTAGLYLDGEAFGRSAADVAGVRTGLPLPSGDGRRGGDFESWFWLTP